MTKQKFEVQRHLELVYVARQNGDIPQPGPDEVLLQMVACGICGADIRVMTGIKWPQEKQAAIRHLGMKK